MKKPHNEIIIEKRSIKKFARKENKNYWKIIWE